MRFFIKYSVLCGLMLFILAGMIQGQTGYRSKYEFGEPRFAIEAADFRSDEVGLNNLEIYYKIFYDALSYRKVDGGYEAKYEVEVIVEGDDNIQLEGLVTEGRIFVKSFEATRRAGDFVVNLVNLQIEPQDVKIRANLQDVYAGTARLAEQDVKKRDYWGKYPNISRVEFAREYQLTDKESKFNKGQNRVIPSVSRLFGGDNDSLLHYYIEIYPGRSKDKHSKFINQIYHKTKGYVYSDTILYGTIDSVRRELRTINVAEILPGDYELELRIEGRRGKVLNKMIEEFELELTAETMFRNDYKTAVAMLKYLVTSEENKKLKNAKTPEERRQAWDEFWSLRDADVHTRENPTKQEYFRRIRHSNRYFSFMRKAGWKTGRGMVYIIYGEPDEVEDYPFELATKPYQYWHYYRSTPPRRFRFVDEWGDGDYELQPPFNGISF